ARSGAAGRKPTRDDANRAARGKRNVDRPANREISAHGDEARPVQRRDGFVDRERFGDPVQVEREAQRAEEHLSRKDDVAPATAERRIHESVGLGGYVERGGQRSREEPRDAEYP